MSKISYNLASIRAFAFDMDGVLSKSTMLIDHDGNPMRTANVKDGFAIQLAIKQGYRIVIITGGKSRAMEVRLRDLGVTDIFQSTAVKHITLRQWMEREGMAQSEVLYMGDDMTDLECIKLVGLPTTPADGDPYIRSVAQYVSVYPGGEGCVRDVIEQVMRAAGTWCADPNSLAW